MPSIKNLKKDINYTLGDLIEECYVWELVNPNAETKQSQAIIDDAITTFDSLLDRVHQKNVENKKKHFQSIHVDLETKAKEIADKINNL